MRVDANGGWSVPDAVDALRALAAYDLEYAEQPCASVEDLAALRVRLARAGIDVLVAADGATKPRVIDGSLGVGPHDVGVTFLNDAWGGTSGTDRNLYVDSLSMNGKGTVGAELGINETLHFTVGG